MESHQWLSHRYERIVLTESHITVPNISFVKKQLVQVYMLPDDEKHELRLSHEAITMYRHTRSWSLLQDSAIDPITGSARLRLLRVY